MSSGDSGTPLDRRLIASFSAIASPTVRTAVIMWLVTVVVFVLLYMAMSSRNREAPKPIEANSFPAIEPDRQPRKSDPSDIADLEALSKQVERLHKALGAESQRIREMTARTDESKSQKAVAQAKTAVLQADVAAARSRLEKIKSLHARWTARSASLLSGDSGRRVVASAPHLQLASELYDRERPTDVDLQRLEVQLELLGGPLEVVPAEQRAEIAISAEHAKMLSDLGQQLSVWLVAYDQQTLLLDAILAETESSQPTDVTLESAIRQHRVQAEKEVSKRLSQARDEARKNSEKTAAEHLARLEEQAVAANLPKGTQNGIRIPITPRLRWEPNR